MFQGMWVQLQTQTGTAPAYGVTCESMEIDISIVQKVMWWHNTHHCENKPWLLNTLSLHHLEDIHHTLTLAAVNGGSYGTEHSWPADSVTGGGEGDGGSDSCSSNHGGGSLVCVVHCDWPAVDHNGFVVSPTLYIEHSLNHSNNGLWVGALPLRVPVKYLKLNHLLWLPRL